MIIPSLPNEFIYIPEKVSMYYRKIKAKVPIPTKYTGTFLIEFCFKFVPCYTLLV